ncbi:MAG: rod shape-determining protein MreC [Clostridiales Family XIII bacterium]|jgi:rod shape-determining protein MreC|nr:rod shape-determining protein MreC [Clostridiales Family XIII bacterium]
MRWLKQHSRTTATAAALAILAVVILASYQTFGEDNILGRAAGRAIRAVQTPFAYAAAFLDRQSAVFLESEGLAEENEALRERVGELERELIEAKLSEADLAELRRLAETLDYAGLDDTHSLVTADVVAFDGSSGFRIFTIDAGADRGIEVDDVVMDGNGLVGRVMSVGEGWAKVISVIDESNKVGFHVFRNLEWLGVMQGDGEGGLSGYMLDETVPVREGDRLISSGIGGVYPKGIFIGRIVGVEWNHDSPLKTVSIEPAANFKNIRKVTVLL